MNCLIIDDEPLAIEVIENYINKIGGITIVGKCTNPLNAIALLGKHKIDLIFLDIEMPNISGIDFVKSVENLPQFIFTTAYPEYALDGFDLNAVDYLVKPIPFYRFLKAVARAKEKFGIENKVAPSHLFSANTGEINKESERDFVFVKAEYENQKINFNEIKYIQGLKDYLKIHLTTTKKPVLILSNFKEILDKLPSTNFIRVHRSYIVNVSHIKALQKTKIVIGDDRIPIGETYKKEVIERLGL